MLIRRAEPSDLDAAVAIDPQDRRSLIEPAFRDGHARVALRAGQIAAFGIVTTQFFQRPFIELVIVREADRRRGIGRAIVEAIVRDHVGQRVFTSTNESNAPMRALLAHLRFEAAGVVHGLDPGDPELLFYIDA